MNLNGIINIDSINLTDYVSDFTIERPEIQNGLHKALVVIYNPGGRWNTTCNIGKSVEMQLGWGTPGDFFKGTIYDRKIVDGDKLELFIGQKGWNEMLFQSNNEVILDREVSDIAKDVMVGSGVGVTNVEFGSGAEVIDTDFHNDEYPNEDNIATKSNVTRVIVGDNYPADQDAWTEDIEEENHTDFGTEGEEWYRQWTGQLTDDAVTKHDGSYSKKFVDDSSTLNAAWRYTIPEEDRFYWQQFKQMKIWIYREDVEVTNHFYMRLGRTTSFDQANSEIKDIPFDISDQAVDTWQEYTIEKSDTAGVYEDLLDSWEVRYIWVLLKRELPSGKGLFFDGLDIILETWDSESEFVLSKDTGVKQEGTASIEGTHRTVYFEDDFNDDTDDTPPDDWTIGAVGADYKILSCSYWTSRHNYGDLGIWDGDRSCNIIDMNTSNKVYMYKLLGTGATGSGIIRFIMSADRNIGEEGWTTFLAKNNADADEIGFRIKHDYTNNETDMEYKDSGGWHALTSMTSQKLIYVEIDYNETAATYDLTVTSMVTKTQTVSGKAFINNGIGLKKVQFETETAGKSRSMVDGFFWGTESGGSNTNRELWYHSAQDLALDCELYSWINFHIRQNVTDEDPVLRLYSSTGNFFYRTLDITGAGSFQEFNIELGSSASGWSQTGTPDWENINWIAFYHTAAMTDVTATYIDKLYFTDPSGAYWKLDKDADDPVDKELGTENEASEWGSNEYLVMTNSTDPKHTGSYATGMQDTSADSFTDDDAADFDGDFTQMVDTNDKLEMDDIITEQQTSSNADGYNYVCWQQVYLEEGEEITQLWAELFTNSGTKSVDIILQATKGGATLTSVNVLVTTSCAWYGGTCATYKIPSTGTYWFQIDATTNLNWRYANSGSPYRDTNYAFWYGSTKVANGDGTFKIYACAQTGDYVSSSKDALTTDQWATMDITSALDGATIKLYTDSNNDDDFGTPSWTLRATLSGGAEVDIDISAEDGRYMKYKIDVEADGEVDTWIDDIDIYYGTGGAGQTRNAWYPSAKNWAKDLSNKHCWNFWFYQDTDEDIEVRMYTSAGNYYSRTLSTAIANTWEQHNIHVGTGATGWSTTGSPNWNDIDWLEFYISSAKTRTVSYIDEQYFDAFKTSGYIISTRLLTDNFDYFDDAKFDCETTIPTGTTITRKASNDDGANYDTCVEDTWTPLADHHSTASNHGRLFKYKIEMTGGTDTPTLSATDIDIKYIPIIVLSKFERKRESRLQTVQRLANINNSDGFIDLTPDLHFFPAGTKASGKTISRQKGIWNFDEARDEHSFRNKVYLHGASDITFPLQSDDFCEGDAGTWNGDGITLSDDIEIFKIGEKSIRGLVGLTTGWYDDCQDDVINTTYWEQYKTGSNTIVEANGYIRCYTGAYPTNTCFIYFKPAYELAGNFDISFSVRTNDPLLESVICAFVTNAPIKGTFNWCDANLDYIKFDSPGTIVLCRAGLARVTLKTNVNANEMYQIRITRVSTTHTIYINGEQVWSGTTIVDNDHDNIEFGDFRTNEKQTGVSTDYDNFNYAAVGAAESTATSPAFTKNLDLYKSLHLWYSQDSLGLFTIRVRTDASNYYSWTVTPTLINEFFELVIPIGSLSAGWSTTGSPSWQNITDIMFVYPNGTSTAIFHIDELCFLAHEVIVYSELVSGSYGTAAYGIKELRIYDRSITDRNYAGEIVKGLRGKLDEPLDSIVLFALLDTGIDPGDSVTLVVPDRSISGLYYVKDLSYKKGYKMKCVFTNSERNLEHLLLGFDTQDRGIAQGVVEGEALEICVD